MEKLTLNKKNNKQVILQAAEFLNAGGVVIFPTDTVYGFLALAESKKAVSKIYKIKNRPKTKLLPVFVKDLKMAKQLAEISPQQLKILKLKWPGKYTFVLPAHVCSCHSGLDPESRNAESVYTLDSRLRGNDNTIALRIPNYKPLNDLLKKINKPLAQTSVNISGQNPLTKSADIEAQFKNQKILFIDAGNLKKSKPSKIIDLTGDRLTKLR